MKKMVSIIVVSALASNCALADVRPYAGAALLADFANTDAKRLDGSKMEFRTAYAGELTAGVKTGRMRGEVEIALRGASEAKLDTAGMSMKSSVRHDSYLVNAYYDIPASGPFVPYVGAGIGLGRYRQEYDINGLRAQTEDKTKFEWQAGAGIGYALTPNVTGDLGYRYNASKIDGNDVSAHEIKAGARYNF